MVHTLLLRPEDADGVVEVFDEFFPDVRPPRCVSRIGRESVPISQNPRVECHGCRHGLSQPQKASQSRRGCDPYVA